LVRTSASGTWCARQVPSTGRPSTNFGPVQPFGVRSTIIGQRRPAPTAAAVPRAAPWMARIWPMAPSSAAAIFSCIADGSSPETYTGS
jgi:hypothetical protein